MHPQTSLFSRQADKVNNGFDLPNQSQGKLFIIPVLADVSVLLAIVM